MREDKNYRFRVNVSVDPYESKDEATSCLTGKGAKAIGKNNKMAFIEQEVDIDEFITKALEGHSFCGLFDVDPDKKYWVKRKNGMKNNIYPVYKRGTSKGALKIEFKRNEFFKGAHVVFVDVDETRFDDVGEYIASLTFKPSCVYMSYSDGKSKGGKVSRRFHVVYVFEEELDKAKFVEVSKILTSIIEKDTKEKMEDTCGERFSQYFNGCYGNSETYLSYLIYSYYDIIKNNNRKEEKKDNNSNYLLTIDELQKCPKNSSQDITFNQNLVLDMTHLDYDDFMTFNRHKYKYFYRTESDDWIDGSYQFTDDTYLCLYFNKEKLHDGEKRRKRLFDRCCLRRLIDPSIDADTLLFNLYEDVHRFFDNSDEVLTIEKLQEKVVSSMSYTIEELTEMYSETITYYQSNRPNVIFKSGTSIVERNIRLKEARYNLIQEEYNRNLTISENLALLQDKGFDIEKTTLYNFVKSKDLPTKPNKEPIHEVLKKHYDTSLSIRKNLTNLKAFAPSINEYDVRKYRKSLGV